MKRVQLLSDEVIKKIAAGEVVERPASVVKELVENSLDAGARKIIVELEEGGTERITVQDDGCGIPAEDCLLALSRHATSKLSQDEDLFNIETLGFRGEALAAISAIANFSLCSRVRGTEQGCKLTIEGGGTPILVPWVGNEGTTITVSKLFCTVPVRAKFLKGPDTEFANCHDLVQALALSSPHVGFSLFHNGKLKFSAPALEFGRDGAWRGEKTLRERWALIAGREEAELAIYVREENEYGRWEALLSAPGRDKATHKNVVHFVNGRWVKDKILNFGILRGYHSHLLKGRHPQVLSFFECDPSLVDVNVHPAKTELRFQYPAEVQGLMSFAIRKHMRAAEWARTEQDLRTEQCLRAETLRTEQVKESMRSLSVLNISENDSYSSSKDITQKMPAGDISQMRQMSLNGISVLEINKSSESEKTSLRPNAEILRSVIPTVIPTRTEQTANSLFQQSSQDKWKNLHYIGTYAKCYLLFEDNTQLLAIDQHAFHERILYERLCSNPRLLAQSQPLMMPEALSLTANHIEALRTHEHTVRSAGFIIKFLNETTVEICAVPTLLVHKNYEDVFQHFAEKLGEGCVASAQHVHHDLMASIACHAAVRAGEELSPEELRTLLGEAETVDFYHNCPHGRRVFRTFEKSQVAKWFDR